MTTRLLLIAAPAAFSVGLWFHPLIGDYDGLAGVTTRFQVIHVAMVLTLCVVALGMYVLLDGLEGRAAAVARIALVPFIAFYVPYVAFEGFALGVLGQELNGLPAAQREAVATRLVEEFATNPVMGEPGVFWALGSIAWITAVVATVVAFRRAGARMPLQVLLGASALIAAHAPPVAPVGLLCFAAAGWIVLRERRDAAAVSGSGRAATAPASPGPTRAPAR